jgi:hypothetical protein
MITCYEGRQGSGKTAMAVLDAMKRYKHTGGKLYTNMKSFVYYGKKATDIDFEYVNSFDMLKKASRGVVLLDEAHVWFFSRQWAKFPYDLLFFWSQARKRQLEIIYTVQDLERIDTLIRDLTDEVIRFRRFFSGVSFRWEREGIAKKWRWRWLALYKRAFGYYDSHEVIWFPLENFDSFGVGKEFINGIETSLYRDNPPDWWSPDLVQLPTSGDYLRF